MFQLLGRRASYRIGRALYSNARGEVHNDMMTNGEMLVQNCVVDAWKKEWVGEQRLVVFDVGANVGDWSSALLSLLTKSRDMSEAVDLYAFEPVPSTFQFLRKRLGTQNAVLHYEQVALSSEKSEGTMYISGVNSASNSLNADPLRGDMKPVAIVKTTVADFCRAHRIRKVQLLKCDAEGHDMEVIRGALPLLARGSISVLQFEYNHQWIFSRHFLRDVFMALEKLPYKIAKLQPHRLLILSGWHPELEKYFEGNYVLVHVDALKWFPRKQASFDCYNTMCVERQ